MVSFLTITEPGITEAPVFNPGAGNFEGSVTVSIACATPGAEIWYTTSGNNPRLDIPNSFTKLYTGPITLFTSSTIKAIATKSGMTNSKLVSGNFVINNSSVVANPTFSPAPGSSPIAQTITISTATPDAQIFYTTNGNMPRFDVPNSFTKLYTGPFTLSSSATIRAIATKSGMSNSTVSVGIYTIGAGRKALDSGDDINEYFEVLPETPTLLMPHYVIYPNPGAGRFFIKSIDATEDAELTIYNAIGAEIWTGKTRNSNGLTEIDIQKQPAGVYLLRIHSSGLWKDVRISKY
jgi:hypothetical protein